MVQSSYIKGFSNFLPVDGGMARDDASIYMWYGDDAIYFGVIAKPKKMKLDQHWRIEISLKAMIISYLYLIPIMTKELHMLLR
ncbi:MAG: hypothetical protein Ct9H90mP7_3120 [Candidatus Neomarinimicrobiota bacterium]|nr:MAG: hypothetical protein Ct9H90mP7_3120 [Candidatus Neomarinimicrobiota bacterium]